MPGVLVFIRCSRAGAERQAWAHTSSSGSIGPPETQCRYGSGGFEVAKSLQAVAMPYGKVHRPSGRSASEIPGRPEYPEAVQRFVTAAGRQSRAPWSDGALRAVAPRLGPRPRHPVLNLSDEHLRDRFLGFAREVLARYGAPDVPTLDVNLGRESNLGPATAAWLRDAMERVVESISVSVTAPGSMYELTLPRGLRAKSISLRLSGVTFEHGPLVLPEPGAPTSFGALTKLSVSRVSLQEQRVRPLGEFLSSCCPRLRKLRLTEVSGGLRLRPLVLHLDMLEELVLDHVESLNKLQVVSANLRVLGVLSCFESLSQRHTDTVVEISAPRLEAVGWSGFLPKHLSFLHGSHCIRRLSGLRFYLSGKEFLATSAVRLLEMCSSADHLSVCIDIPDCTPSMLIRELSAHELEQVPHLPNIRVLSLQLATLRFIGCSIAPIIFSLLRLCPNLTRLHIDLSTLNQFSWLDYLMDPDIDDTEVKKPCQSSDSNPWNACGDQLQLDTLREIRISGFMGTDLEMELVDILFGVVAARPALERISISLSPRLLRHMDSNGVKIKARFPLDQYAEAEHVRFDRVTPTKSMQKDGNRELLEAGVEVLKSAALQFHAQVYNGEEERTNLLQN
ncbi:hypothetical protein C2845_PM03G09430 [Panicum miliaceum]|uniref:FBD domain-containing protein n=1 Tax=Panicum miliaceum TaxID=4540 RepID=A0A3L6TCV3_PANMI|nr:hypothetical protein C2845_PM03G09430 [Panicum miliaceum]